MISKLEQMVADEAIKELITFQEALAPLDKMISVIVDVLALIRDGKAIPDEMLDFDTAPAEALNKFDFSRAQAAFERVAVLMAAHFEVDK